MGVKSRKGAYPVKRVEVLETMLGYVIARGDLEAYAGAFLPAGWVFGVRDAHVSGRVNPRSDCVANTARGDDDWFPNTQGVRDADNGL